LRGVQWEPGELPPVRTDTPGSEQIDSRALQLAAAGGSPTRLAVGSEEDHGSTRLSDQAGAVAADPDLSMLSHKRVEAADGMMAVRSARLDIDVIHHARHCDGQTATPQAAFR
jgi:hypothetical protein